MIQSPLTAVIETQSPGHGPLRLSRSHRGYMRGGTPERSGCRPPLRGVKNTPPEGGPGPSRGGVFSDPPWRGSGPPLYGVSVGFGPPQGGFSDPPGGPGPSPRGGRDPPRRGSRPPSGGVKTGVQNVHFQVSPDLVRRNREFRVKKVVKNVRGYYFSVPFSPPAGAIQVRS